MAVRWYLRYGLSYPPPLTTAVLPVMNSGLPETPVVVNVPLRPL